MISDMYGQLVYTEDDLCDLFMENSDIKIKDMQLQVRSISIQT
jgi:hypothetical protein